jgi:hypothetical protein
MPTIGFFFDRHVVGITASIGREVSTGKFQVVVAFIFIDLLQEITVQTFQKLFGKRALGFAVA